MFGGEDDDDFVPAPNSNLATLFGRPLEEGGNASLTYTAPKQPKKGQTDNTPQGSIQKAAQPGLRLIIAKPVETYKLEAGNYNAVGKLGGAVLGNPASRLYQLLLYKNKQQHVTATKITDKFQYTVQKESYASFYDDNGQNWSIMFDSEQDAVSFAREVGIACACVPGEQDQKPFYAQDLKIGEGVQAELGDLLEIRYTTLPLVDGSLKEAIETNMDSEKPQRVKIRKGVWEEALMGVSRGCKRLIVLAPALFGPWKPLVNAAYRLVVVVEVGRVKASRKVHEVLLTEGPAVADSSESNIDSGTDESSIKARGASISEALTNSPKTNKASIISRMARMGQATLPLKGAVVANPSDSEETEEEPSGTSKPVAKPSLKSRFTTTKSRPALQITSVTDTTPKIKTRTTVSSSPAMPEGGHHVALFQPPAVSWPQQHVLQQHPQYIINGIPVSVPTHPEGHVYPATTPHQVVPGAPIMSTSAPSSDTHMAVYVAENRTHNAEVRMGLNKVTDKVDQVLVKMESLQPHHRSGSGVLDPHSLLQCIQKLVSDNDKLQAEGAEKQSRIEQQNEKLYELLHQKCLEQSAASAAEQRQDFSLQTMVMALQQEKTKLAVDLKEAHTQMHSMTFQVGNMEQLKEEMSKLTVLAQTQQQEINHCKQTIVDQESVIRALKEKNEAAVYIHQSLESAIAALKTNMRDLEVAKVQLESDLAEAQHKVDGAAQVSSQQVVAVQQAHRDEITKLRQQVAAYANENKAEDTDVKDEQLKKLENENEELSKTLQILETQLKAARESAGGPLLAIEEVKKIMNVTFKLLKSEFVPDTMYEGDAVRATILSSIQEVTHQYVRVKSKSKAETKSEEVKESADTAECSPKKASEYSDQETEKSAALKPISEIPVPYPNVKENDKTATLKPLSDIPVPDPKVKETEKNAVLKPISDIPVPDPNVKETEKNAALKPVSDIPVPDPKVKENDKTATLKPLSDIPVPEPNIQENEDNAVSEELKSKVDEEVKPDLKINDQEQTEEKKPEAEITTPKVVPPAPPTVPPLEEDTDSKEVEEEETKSENEPKDSLTPKGDQQTTKPREPSLERGWRPQPPPSPLFDDDDDEDDWLSSKW